MDRRITVDQDVHELLLEQCGNTWAPSIMANKAIRIGLAVLSARHVYPIVPRDIIAICHSRGIKLSVVGNELVMSHATEAPPDWLVDLVRKNKHSIIAQMARSSASPQATLPNVDAPAPAPNPVAPKLPASMERVLSKLNGSPVEGTAEELVARGFGATAHGLGTTLYSMQARGLISRESIGCRRGTHGSPVNVWRVQKAVAS